MDRDKVRRQHGMNEGEALKCPMCREAFSSNNAAFLHLRKVHKENGSICGCSVCPDKAWRSPEGALLHFNKCEDGLFIWLPLDGSSAASTASATTPRDSADEYESNPYAPPKPTSRRSYSRLAPSCACPTCFDCFHSAQELDEHITTAHPQYERWVCSTCKEKFTLIVDANAHCENCPGAKVLSKSPQRSMRSAARRKLSDATNSRRADSPGSPLNSSTPKGYRFTMGGEEQPPYDDEPRDSRMDVSGMSGGAGEPFVKQEPRVYGGVLVEESFHECLICKRNDFKDQLEMILHGEQTHKDWPSTWYTCKICQVSFKRIRSLIEHKKTHAESANTTVEEPASMAVEDGQQYEVPDSNLDESLPASSPETIETAREDAAKSGDNSFAPLEGSEDRTLPAMETESAPQLEREDERDSEDSQQRQEQQEVNQENAVSHGSGEQERVGASEQEQVTSSQPAAAVNRSLPVPEVEAGTQRLVVKEEDISVEDQPNEEGCGGGRGDTTTSSSRSPARTTRDASTSSPLNATPPAASKSRATPTSSSSQETPARNSIKEERGTRSTAGSPARVVRDSLVPGRPAFGTPFTGWLQPAAFAHVLPRPGIVPNPVLATANGGGSSGMQPTFGAPAFYTPPTQRSNPSKIQPGAQSSSLQPAAQIAAENNFRLDFLPTSHEKAEFMRTPTSDRAISWNKNNPLVLDAYEEMAAPKRCATCRNFIERKEGDVSTAMVIWHIESFNYTRRDGERLGDIGKRYVHARFPCVVGRYPLAHLDAFHVAPALLNSYTDEHNEWTKRLLGVSLFNLPRSEPLSR